MIDLQPSVGLRLEIRLSDLADDFIWKAGTVVYDCDRHTIFGPDRIDDNLVLREIDGIFKKISYAISQGGIIGDYRLVRFTLRVDLDGDGLPAIGRGGSFKQMPQFHLVE